MPISLQSRYLSDKVARVVSRDGTRTVIVPKPIRTRTFDFTYYQWQEGDRIDVVARDYFDDERLWYVIAEANPEVLVWTDLAPGTVIRIPSG